MRISNKFLALLNSSKSKPDYFNVIDSLTKDSFYQVATEYAEGRYEFENDESVLEFLANYMQEHHESINEIYAKLVSYALYKDYSNSEDYLNTSGDVDEFLYPRTILILMIFSNYS